ncbi:MAG: ATP-binding cassette domain-containing protein, partial [Chloroflexi bacterium]|nr:ATP-binding cassette domain-containing protein [Chloroflexota bacterium]
MILVDDLHFGYGEPSGLFAGLSWRVAPGETWAIVGPSGCGKTTLLALIAGLRRPARGRLLVEGQSVHGPRPSTGLILQDYGLLPWARTWENAALGLRIRGVPGRQARAVAEKWLERLGLAGLAERYPAELSGGQRQRVAIARALATAPDLLLMDEPFASLDAFTREELQDQLRDISAARALTRILVTHDVAEAVYLGDRILVLGPLPQVHPTVVDNPEAREIDWRRQPAFYERCAQIRAAVRPADHPVAVSPRTLPPLDVEPLQGRRPGGRPDSPGPVATREGDRPNPPAPFPSREGDRPNPPALFPSREGDRPNPPAPFPSREGGVRSPRSAADPLRNGGPGGRPDSPGPVATREGDRPNPPAPFPSREGGVRSPRSAADPLR